MPPDYRIEQPKEKLLAFLERGLYELESIDAKVFEEAKSGTSGTPSGVYIAQVSSMINSLLEGYTSGRVNYDRDNQTNGSLSPRKRPLLEKVEKSYLELKDSSLENKELTVRKNKTTPVKSFVSREMNYLYDCAVNQYGYFAEIVSKQGVELSGDFTKEISELNHSSS